MSRLTVFYLFIIHNNAMFVDDIFNRDSSLLSHVKIKYKCHLPNFSFAAHNKWHDSLSYYANEDLDIIYSMLWRTTHYVKIPYLKLHCYVELLPPIVSFYDRQG